MLHKLCKIKMASWIPVVSFKVSRQEAGVDRGDTIESRQEVLRATLSEDREWKVN